MDMKTKQIKNWGLKISLLLLLAVNMSWLQNGFQANPYQEISRQLDLKSNSRNVIANEMNTTQETELASMSPPQTDVAGSIPEYVLPSYESRIKAQKGKTIVDNPWRVTIHRPVERTAVDAFGTLDAEGKKVNIVTVSARVEGCYSINCQKSIELRADKLNTKDGGQLTTQVQQAIGPLLEELTKKEADQKEQARLEEEKSKKEEEKQAKLEKDIANCKKDEDGHKLSGNKQLECRADKLGSKEGDELEDAYAEIHDDLRTLLFSTNSKDQKLGRKLLAQLTRDGSLPRSMRNELYAMKAGSSYLAEYPQALQEYLTSLNPIQKQIAMGKLTYLDQTFQYDTSRLSQDQSTSNEFAYWTNAIRQRMASVISNPNASLTTDTRSNRSTVLTSNNSQSTRYDRTNPVASWLSANGSVVGTGSHRGSLTSSITAIPQLGQSAL